MALFISNKQSIQDFDILISVDLFIEAFSWTAKVNWKLHNHTNFGHNWLWIFAWRYDFTALKADIELELHHYVSQYDSHIFYATVIWYNNINIAVISAEHKSYCVCKNLYNYWNNEKRAKSLDDKLVCVRGDVSFGIVELIELTSG